MGMQEKLQELRNGFETAYIDKTSTSNLAYKPQLNKIAARWPAKAVAQFYFY